ncbi:MAG: InlB B-repeat-containing protein, partial [Oscillospiraceae bacterium]|nr:InlB B-repeat-containing protein [Candidatus Ruminococcus equi]
MTKKILSVVLCIVMVLSIFTIIPFEFSAQEVDICEQGATIDEVAVGSVPYPNSMYITQQTNVSCTLAAATMMLRGRWYRSNNDGWSSITENSVSGCAWAPGLYYTFTYRDSSGNYATVNHGTCGGMSLSTLKSLLNSHPEGIEVYCNGIPHAVWVTDYEGDTIYAADPGQYGYGPDRRTLARTFLGAKYGSQANVLANINEYWYVSNYSIKSSAHTCNHNVYKWYWASHPHYKVYACSICGKEWVDYNSPTYVSTCSDCNHTVTYNANGGSGAPSSQTKKFLSTLTLSSTIPTRENYDFLGWAINKDATTPDYQPGDTYKSDTSLTLYAVWELAGYKITYDANGGKYPPQPQIKPIGENINITDETPTRSFYVFLGWSENQNATTPDYKSGGIYSQEQDATLYAVWRKPTEMQENNSYNLKLNEDSDYLYFSFTPSETGYYSFVLEGKNIGEYEITDKNGQGGKFNASTSMNETFAEYLEYGETYYISLSDNKKGILQGSVLVKSLGFNSFSMTATKSVKQNDNGYDFKDFEPAIILYKNNDIIFSGTYTEYVEYVGWYLYISVDFSSVEGVGNFSVPVEIGGCYINNKRFNMDINIIDNPIEYIEVIKNDYVYYENCEHCHSYEFMDYLYDVQKAGKGIELKIHYRDGSDKIWKYSDSNSFYYLGHEIRFSVTDEVVYEYEEWGCNKENIIEVTYNGKKTTFSAKMQESPVKNIVVLNSLVITEYESGKFSYYDGKFSYDLDELLSKNNIRLKVIYKDNTFEYITIDSYKKYLHFYDTEVEHTPCITCDCSDWTTGGNDNYILINYLGYSTNVNVEIMKDDSFDEIEDFDILSVQSFDDYYFFGKPEYEEPEIEVKFASGNTKRISLQKEGIKYPYSLSELIINGRVYNYGIFFNTEGNRII